MKKHYLLLTLIIGIILFSISVTAVLPTLEERQQQFEITAIESPWIITTLNDKPTITITITNTGADGYGYVEAGFYERTFLTNKGYTPLALIQDLNNNCNDNELYTHTKRIYLKSGEKTKVNIQVQAPQTGTYSLTQNSGDDFGIGVTTFTGCYAKGGKIMSTGYKNTLISLRTLTTSDTQPKDYCKNARTDGTETDMNCGGACVDLGQKCEIHGNCGLTTDCKTGLVCADSGTCEKVGSTSNIIELITQNTSKAIKSVGNILSYWWVLVIGVFIFFVLQRSSFTLNWVAFLIILVIIILGIALLQPTIWDKIFPKDVGLFATIKNMFGV